ncbi:hypothetical protein EVAR_16873_1 [Eumeta japonica]|uniref:Uncharacterized protein n=1 Tax=Eumeta variegata TaxID=151549 RepID=A0A4C1V2H0_EUMVA|nr:hypothetical protein EVAR_16873_1 [Eumeta japonica]
MVFLSLVFNARDLRFRHGGHERRAQVTRPREGPGPGPGQRPRPRRIPRVWWQHDPALTRPSPPAAARVSPPRRNLYHDKMAETKQLRTLLYRDRQNT